LDSRTRAEFEFHNRDRDPAFRKNAGEAGDTYEKFYGNQKYYAATRRSSNYIFDWISAHANGKVFLDYACGNGGYAIHAAKAGAARSLGFDISDVSVQNVRRRAQELGFAANTRFFPG